MDSYGSQELSKGIRAKRCFPGCLVQDALLEQRRDDRFDSVRKCRAKAANTAHIETRPQTAPLLLAATWVYATLVPRFTGGQAAANFPVFIGDLSLQTTCDNRLALRQELYHSQVYSLANYLSGSAFWTVKFEYMPRLCWDFGLADYRLLYPDSLGLSMLSTESEPRYAASRNPGCPRSVQTAGPLQRLLVSGQVDR